MTTSTLAVVSKVKLPYWSLKKQDCQARQMHKDTYRHEEHAGAKKHYQNNFVHGEICIVK